jgi:hypothetical protein
MAIKDITEEVERLRKESKEGSIAAIRDLVRRIKAYQAHVAGAPNQQRFIELCDELFAAIPLAVTGELEAIDFEGASTRLTFSVPHGTRWTAGKYFIVKGE